jgi:dimethylhistidine N-methyltransferase
MRCEEIMTREIECVRPDDTAKQAAITMRDENIDFLPVCDAGKVLRTLTDRDISIRLVAQGKSATTPVADMEGPKCRASLVKLRTEDSFGAAVAKGLAQRPRSLPPRYFYDAEGSALFERITGLPEYYLTRTEAAILDRRAAECPPADTLVELGCGAATKTQLLLDRLFRDRPSVAYMPVDISESALLGALPPLLDRYPGLTVHAFCGEYQQALERLPRRGGLVLFLGSNIGNLEPPAARALLASLREHRVLVGFDMQKPLEPLVAAYDDAEGVTARFNRNLLARINRELGGDFELDAFEHRAIYNGAAGRIEMHLVSARRQEVRVEGLRTSFSFAAGETIHTENSYKFTPAQIAGLAAAAGLRLERAWVDEQAWFTVALLGGGAR